MGRKVTVKQVFLKKNEKFFGILLHLYELCVILLHISEDVVLCS